MTASHLEKIATIGSEKWLRLRLPLCKGKQRKRPRPGVSDAGAAAAAKVYPLSEMARDFYCVGGISILPVGTSIKGELSKIVSKRINYKIKQS